jgi:hypothetical protein
MAADTPYGEFYDFHSASAEYFGGCEMTAIGISPETAG